MGATRCNPFYFFGLGLYVYLNPGFLCIKDGPLGGLRVLLAVRLSAEHKRMEKDI